MTRSTPSVLALEDGVEDRGFRVEIGVGELVPVDQHEIGRLADRQGADMAAIGGRRRTANGGHAQYLARARDVLLIHPRNPVRAQHHAHLLQHVAVVIDPGLVEADRGIDAALLEEIQRRHTAAQSEIRAAIVGRLWVPVVLTKGTHCHTMCAWKSGITPLIH
jgi:hypothetical protein